MLTNRNLRILRTVVKVFGPEQGALILAQADGQSGGNRDSTPSLVAATPLLKQELREIENHLASLGDLLGLGCIGFGSRLRSQGIRWIQPSTYSDAESRLVRQALQGRVVLDLKPVELFLPTSVVVDPVAIDGNYLYVQEGVEQMLALLAARGFPLYLIDSSAKHWYPYALFRETDIVPLPIGFIRFYKLVTMVGFINPVHSSYVPLLEDSR